MIPSPWEGVSMTQRGFTLLLTLFFLLMSGSLCNAQIYKWVDEKGTVHFSESPASGVVKSQDKSQGKALDKNQETSQNRSQNRVLDKKEGKGTAKENDRATLKHLEVGNRYIPEDMKKYGPAGGYDGPRGGGDSPGVQRGSS
jgi:hypothetical protein